MWVMLNDSFLSIVAPTPGSAAAKAGKLMVRARFAGDIERLFARAEVEQIAGRDYLFRAAIPRDLVAAAMMSEVQRIDYGNFKDSVKERWRHDAYLDVWSIMHAEQARQAEPAPVRKKAVALKAKPPAAAKKANPR